MVIWTVAEALLVWACTFSFTNSCGKCSSGPRSALQAEQAAGASHQQMPNARLQASSTSADMQPDCCGVQGQAFCFLPLPVYTSLPVHVNG